VDELKHGEREIKFIQREVKFIQRRSFQEESKHPVIIPKDSVISELIARHFHHIAGHSGLEHVLSLIREHFWLIRARVILKKMLNNCVSCKKGQAP
jgi:hypothetical protein